MIKNIEDNVISKIKWYLSNKEKKVMHLCWEKQNAHTQNIIVRFCSLKVIDTFIKMFDEHIYDTSGDCIFLQNSFVISWHLTRFDFINSTAPRYSKNAFLPRKDLFRDLVTFLPFDPCPIFVTPSSTTASSTCVTRRPPFRRRPFIYLFFSLPPPRSFFDPWGWSDYVDRSICMDFNLKDRGSATILSG